MKICKECKLEKELSEFSSSKNKICPYCKLCKKTKSKEWYRRNKTTHCLRVTKNNLQIRSILREFVNTLKTKPCLDCGKTYPSYCMDFDHLENKEFSISNAVTQNLSKDKILLEISKCELVCANCHRIRTYIRAHSSNG